MFLRTPSLASVKYYIAGFLLFASSCVMAAEAPTFDLPYNSWRLISIPATPPGSESTLGAIFGDDIGVNGNYGQNWVVYAYNAGTNEYGNPVSLTDKLEKGRGYWIVQIVNEGKPVTLKMPPGSTETPKNQSILLASPSSGPVQWNLAGNPFATPLNLADLRLITTAPSCSDGNCDLDKAKTNNLLQNKLFTYDGNRYIQKGTDDQLDAWDGFWLLALGGSASHSLALGTNTLSEADAARFLTQATFGPTLTDINHLVSLGDFDAWLNEQFTLPLGPSLRLPAMRDQMVDMCDAALVNADPDFGDKGAINAFSEVWWDATIADPAQLRHRVAFALSEIFVVSRRGDAGNLNHWGFGLAAYYDVLLRNAFGNYRELLEEVTLHPVMGRYLSMLFNEKADQNGTVRPDENYAREVMQLFSIGVHQLNTDGTLDLDNVGKPVPTYTQQDVEQFAKVFTGWGLSGNPPWSDLKGNTTVPMKVFESFHDTTEKQLLNGIVLPAGQTAQQDLDGALDNLFNHPTRESGVF